MKYIRPTLSIKRFADREEILTGSGDGVLNGAVEGGSGGSYTESVSYNKLKDAIDFNNGSN